MKTNETTNTQENRELFAFSKSNYLFMLIGFLLIILGFILMSGGKTDNPEVFSEAIFSFRRIVLAPIIILIGFVIEIYAILKKSKS
jgi:uncharacterized Tic20 family protein